MDEKEVKKMSTTGRDEHHDERYYHIDSRVTHLDTRVSSMAEDLSAVKTSVDTLVTAIGKLTDRAAAPQHTNWIGIGTLCLAIIIGGSQYISLRLDPVADNVANLQQGSIRNQDAREKLYQAIGEMTTDLQHFDDQQQHFDKLYHLLDDRVRDAEGELQSNIAKMEAVRANITRNYDYLESLRDSD